MAHLRCVASSWGERAYGPSEVLASSWRRSSRPIRCVASSWGEGACGLSEVLLDFLLGERELTAHLRCVASSWGEAAHGPSEVHSFLVGRRGLQPI